MKNFVFQEVLTAINPVRGTEVGSNCEQNVARTLRHAAAQSCLLDYKTHCERSEQNTYTFIKETSHFECFFML